MKNEKFYDVSCISYADYDFEQCNKKEILSKMLENGTPKSVKKINSKGTSWNLWGEYYNSFNLCINGGNMETSDLIGGFIEDLLFFLPHLARIDNKKLICPFEYEGQITAFMTTPMENDNIRVSVFYANALYKKYHPENKFDADIVIKKDTFLKQICEIFHQVTEDTIKEDDRENYWVKRINCCLGELDKYFKNPEKYKKKYDIKRHCRVFDVAYKDLDNTWKFLVALDDERNALPIHWEREKQQGNILDYDIFEQSPQELFDYDFENNSIKKLSKNEIKKNLENDMSKRKENNWVYSAETGKWYAPNEIMPHDDENITRGIYNNIDYEIKLSTGHSENEDEPLENFIRNSYDIDGELTEDNLGYMDCTLIMSGGNEPFVEIKFDYRNYKQIIECLEKAQNGQYVRFNLDGNRNFKMHIWQYLYDNSPSKNSQDLLVACYDIDSYKEIYSFIVNKKEFINCFTNALDEIQKKLEVTKHLMDVGEKLKIKKKFEIGKGYRQELTYIENFKGGYACVHKDNLDGWGIINKNFEWVIKPKSVTIFGEEHPKYGKELKGWILKYYYLHNIDGKLFIAAKQDGKQYVMDINGDIQIPHVSDAIYYTCFNDELLFIAVDYNRTYIVNSKGEDILTLDFPVGEKFWLFDDIIIVSKDDKYGIIDWKGKVKIDFLFSEIFPEKDSLDFIPVRYIDQWGFINKKGKVIDMKIKEPSEADVKCSQRYNVRL